ncbi:hypothetical protein RIF29_41884 [Crotalaria pallida]|uniref:Secreted protein n=1 Tax=Crotalaria pallida TaxID=3830 RepID=A0AAN9HVS5_CROPI
MFLPLFFVLGPFTAVQARVSCLSIFCLELETQNLAILRFLLRVFELLIFFKIVHLHFPEFQAIEVDKS